MEASSTEVLQNFLASTKEIVNLSEMTWDLFLSKLKVGKIQEIVGLVPKEKLVLLLFVHNGRECLGDRQDKTICYIRLEGFEKQSVLRSFVEALWSLSYRSAESPTGRYGFSARD